VPAPAYYAERVLEILRISAPTDLMLLDAIAYERGAVVRYKSIDGAEARITIAGRRAIITVSTKVGDPRRRRFSVAHELGHFEMHRRQSPLNICTTADMETSMRQAGQQRELDASSFAAALLMPERFFLGLGDGRDPSLRVIQEVADVFSVSLTAAGRRYVELSAEPCAFVYTQDGIVRWFQGSKDFHDLGLFVDVKAKVDPNSLAGLYFRGVTIPERPHRVPAGAWLRKDRFHRQATVLEHSMALPNYRAVLTLLHVDEDPFEEDWLDS
jgi:hypothetical protein